MQKKKGKKTALKKQVSAANRADFLKKTFKKQLFGGYKKSEVLEYIDTMLEALDDERKSLDAEKDVLAMVMLESQFMADSIIQNANEKADNIVAEAERKATSLIRTGVEKNMISMEELVESIGGSMNIKRAINMLIELHHRSDEAIEQIIVPLQSLYTSLGGKPDED